jgi:hypothetical protein
MATSIIKKVTVPFYELPGAYRNDFVYNIRYRVISEDKNRVSHWSRVYNLDAQYDVDGILLIPSLDYSYVTESASSPGGAINTVRLNWRIPPDKDRFSLFDIYLKRCASGACTEAYEYFATTSLNAYTITQLGTETHVQALVQIPVYPKAVSAQGTLFETDPIAL